MENRRRRIGVIGFGKLGEYLVDKILKDDDLELAFVWNRNRETINAKVEGQHVLEDLSDFHKRKPDLVIEVAHPDITKEFAARILQCADYMIGSPTALAEEELFMKLKQAARHHALFIPSGAMWGVEDIQKMADNGTLQALKVSMTLHPKSLKLRGRLKESNELVTKRTILYDGCVRDLCSMAPNNVNTMAAAAIAGHNLGFDRVQCSLIADPESSDWHVVEVDVWGEGDIQSGKVFHVQTVRRNPAHVGAVSGSATLASFYASLKRACGKEHGVHLC